MNAKELLAVLVGVPSVSGTESELADLLVRELGADGFDVQREGDSLWFTIGKIEHPIPTLRIDSTTGTPTPDSSTTT